MANKHIETSTKDIETSNKDIETSNTNNNCAETRIYCDQCQRELRNETLLESHQRVHRWLQSQPPFESHMDIQQQDKIAPSRNKTERHLNDLVETIHVNDVISIKTTSNPLSSQSSNECADRSNRANTENTADAATFDASEVITIHSSGSELLISDQKAVNL